MTAVLSFDKFVPKELQRLLVAGLLYRVAVVCTIILLGNILLPLDSSTKLVSNSYLSPVCNWDGIHFYTIARNWYQYEHNCAFFPLYPALLSFLTPVLTIEIAAILLNLTTFSLSSIILYKVTLIHLSSQEFALSTVKMFIFSASTAFHSAMYSESLFTCLFLCGYYCFLKHRQAVATIFWMLCACCRSNGMLFAGFFMYRAISYRASISARIRYCFSAAMIFSVFAFIQYYFLKRFSFPSLFSYSYIQEKYWNVGLFKYYTWNNLPNFLLAIPSVLVYIAGMQRLAYVKYIDWIVLWSFLTLHCFLFCNVQILTRLVSFAPPYYWTLALLCKERKLMLPKICVWYGIIGCFLFALFYPPA